MRILHVSSVYPPDVTGGAEIVVEMLAEAQAERGHQVGAAYLARAAEPARSRHGVTILPQATRNLLWIDDVFRQPRLLRTANKIPARHRSHPFDGRAAADGLGSDRRQRGQVGSYAA